MHLSASPLLTSTVDVLDGASGLNYADDYRDFGGIMVPTERMVYPSDSQKHKVPEPLLVAIDIKDIELKAA